MRYKLEVIAFDIRSCIIAEKSGANRIELCAGPAEGGTTPSVGMIAAARKSVEIELYVMIRPRGGDFVYSDEEFEIMKEDVSVCKKLGADGIVFGILNNDGTIDMTRCRELIDLAYPMFVTFHRAFDRVLNASTALEDIITLGCERILTSGLHSKASEGKYLIADLIRQAGDRIIIMPGSGINAENIVEMAENTGAIEFHSSASHQISNTHLYSNPDMNETLSHTSINADAVENMVHQLRLFENKMNES